MLQGQVKGVSVVVIKDIIIIVYPNYFQMEFTTIVRSTLTWSLFCTFISLMVKFKL